MAERKAAAPGSGTRSLPGRPHETLIVAGSAYSVGGRNTGLPADPCKSWHYPMEALCGVPGCGQVVRRVEMKPGQLDWEHTGRMPGDPR